MKSNQILLLASAGMALAHPSQDHHNHKRFHELKARQDATQTTIIVGSTVSVYQLNGKAISYDELQEGLKNGTLVLDDDAPIPKPQQAQRPAPPVVIPASKAEPTQAPPPTTTPQTTASPSPSPSPSSSKQSSAAPPPSPSPSPSTAAAPASSGSGSSSSSASSGGIGNVNRAYDNSLSCNEFPSAFGAVALNWLASAPWAGIQSAGSQSSGGYNDMSAPHTCSEGNFCSYSCPPGYEKSQWPSTQGATGQSIGGLQCKGGKLILTQPSTPQLCVSAMNKVTVKIQNNLSKQVAVCRTDYPGSEAMVIPYGVQPGESSTLACPDADTTYKWQGSLTSAQYYVNNAGVSVDEGCNWGSASNPTGNWAPMNLGVGFSNGRAWLSIFQNSPTTQAKLDFDVTLTGDISGSCKYSAGSYIPQQGNGCTVSVSPGGTATYVFSD